MEDGIEQPYMIDWKRRESYYMCIFPNEKNDYKPILLTHNKEVATEFSNIIIVK
jgi:hypothetical protein